MAGGDLLYIFAFIILPTAVLVSCIWALIMLRKGALLPPRPVVTREDDLGESKDGAHETLDLVEETGEHVIVEPATPTRAPVTSPPLADEAPVTTSRAREPSGNEPPVERTQELSVLPEVAAQPVEESRQAADTGESVEVTDAGDARSAATWPAADPASVMMVPLDDVDASASMPVEPEASGPASDLPESLPAATPSPRRPVRRVAQLRPTDAEPSRPRPRAGQRRVGRRVEEE